MVRHRLGFVSIPESLHQHFKVVDPLWKNDPHSLGPLNALNVFIGPNNCGKSRLLRHLFAQMLRVEDWLPGDVEWMAVWRHALSEGQNAAENYWYDARRNMDIGGVRGSTIPTVKELSPEVVGYLELQRKIDVSDLSLINRSLTQEFQSWWDRTFGNKIVHRGMDVPQLPTAGFTTEHAVLCYVPVMRGLRHPTKRQAVNIHDGVDDVYFRRIVGDYGDVIDGFEGNHPRQVFTGLHLYLDIAKRLLGTLEQRESVRLLQNTLSRFFDGDEVVLIPRYDSDVLNVKIGHEIERPIFELGDGLQQIIIIMSQLFFWRDKDLLLFVEEPELFLHPGHQRMLIDAFLDEPIEGSGSRQVFVTTHSHQFLDMTLDTTRMSVFSVHKNIQDGDGRERHGVSTLRVRSSSDIKLLAELGVRNSSVMLTNCTIWVEGITDRMYLRRYLKLFLESGKHRAFQEDLHYSFVEYGGANVVHWSFLDETGPRVERLCGELMLIADQDDPKNNAKQERFGKLRKVLGNRFELLPVREIENLLPVKAIQAVIRSREGDDVKMEPFVHDDYKSQLLGRFIEEKVRPTPVKRAARKYAAESGAVWEKVGFAEPAIASLSSFDDLTPEAQALTTRIYEFIASKNQ